MKSGLLEIADILVVNKGDREGAERTMQQLLGALSIRSGDRGKTPVLKTTATTGEGIAALADAVTRCGTQSAGGDARERRRRRARYLIARAAADLVAQRIKGGGTQALSELADQVLAGSLSPENAARRLLKN
jgi:GTPase